ncbi:MAG TPA: hypothetical protein VK133_02930 [Amoebophilaceae bacterium]|nr:hypothetical protein [Amoebophilaceae bacterium]
MHYNIPLLMVLVFLGGNLAVGLYCKKRTYTLQEYAVGNKNFATSTLVASFLAGIYGGETLVLNVEQTYQLGLDWILLYMISSVSSIWILTPLALRMTPFMQHLSIAETIGSIYGRLPRLITALAGITQNVVMMSIQVNVMARAIQICLPAEDLMLLTIFATLIVIVYSILGGIRTITLTSIFQFLTLAVIIPLLACFLFLKTNYTIAQIVPILGKHTRFQLNNQLQHNQGLVAIAMLFFGRVVGSIGPITLQKAYMSSNVLQARNVFLYATVFRFFINIFILLIGVFVFASHATLTTPEIWEYILTDLSPVVRGILTIALLSMAISSASSNLNTSSIMAVHDLIDSMSITKPAPYRCILQLARMTALAVGLLGMWLSFYQKDLYKLALLTYDSFIPIVTAPLLLAIFGFRGTSYTVLLGMATGTLAILCWNTWILPNTGINGAFVCMIANGLAILAAYYFFPQPPMAGWSEPNTELKQIRQAANRKKNRHRKALKQAWTQAGLAQLKLNQTKLICMGIYVILTTTISTLALASISKFYWYILQLMAGAAFLLGALVSPKKQTHPLSWWASFLWLTGIFFCLPMQVLFCWWKSTNPVATLALSIAHLGIALFLLPLVIGLKMVISTMLIISYFIYSIGLPVLLPLAPYLFPVLGLGILVFALLVFYKIRNANQRNRITYLLDQRNKQNDRELKQWAYNLNLHKKNPLGQAAGDEAVLEEVVETVTQSIAFSDEHMPLYKQDLQSIVDRFREWTLFLKQRNKSKDRLLLQPTETTVEELVQHVETMLEAELGYVPRLLVEKDAYTPQTIWCDVELITKLWAYAILHTTHIEMNEYLVIKIQLQVRPLQFYTTDPIQPQEAKFESYPAIVCVISNASIDLKNLPKVKNVYLEKWEENNIQKNDNQYKEAPLFVGLIKKKMERIVYAHYGQLEFQTDCQKATLIVLPQNVVKIQKEMIERLPIGLLTREQQATPSEQGDAIVELIAFHEHICTTTCVEPAVISEILLLIRRCYGYMRHETGQFFYIRAIGIAAHVGRWVPHSPKVIYAALLYDLVRYARLPLSYIKANFNLGVWCFIQNILAVDQHQNKSDAVLYMGNRLEESVRKENVSVLYVKISERLYDLEQAEGYANKEALVYMAKETLRVDVPLVQKVCFEEPDVAKALEAAAKRALAIGENASS